MLWSHSLKVRTPAFQAGDTGFKSHRRYCGHRITVRYYIQSAYSLPDETKRIQEIRPFRRIDDSFKKIVITKDVVQPNYDEYGILTINIYDFLLNPDCLEK